MQKKTHILANKWPFTVLGLAAYMLILQVRCTIGSFFCMLDAITIFDIDGIYERSLPHIFLLATLL